MALKSLFSSEDLIEMGVYLEESQTLPPSSEDPLNIPGAVFCARVPPPDLCIS